MEIYRAIKRNIKSQGFGDNKLPIYKEYGLLGHQGYDWKLKDGNPVYWDCDIKGTIIDTHIDSNGGLGIVVVSQDKDGIFKHRFWHLKQFYVKAGQEVETGDLLGWGNNTGYSTGPHLHRDVKKLSTWDGGANYTIQDYGNGYKGAIDPEPYYHNIFVLDKMSYLEKKKTLLQKIVEAWAKVVQLTILKYKLL